jgi:hypothetical protein
MRANFTNVELPNFTIPTCLPKCNRIDIACANDWSQTVYMWTGET